MTQQRPVNRERMAGSSPEHCVQASSMIPEVRLAIDAYHEGGKYGQMLVQHVARLTSEPTNDLRLQIAALRRFRGQQSDEQWSAWSGRDFPFKTKELRLALSVVVVVFPSLLKFLKVRSYSSAETTCNVVWGAWLSPRMPRRQLVPSELSALKNADFVRGLVDAVAGPNAADCP